MEELNEILLLLFLIFFVVYALVWFVPPFTSFPFGFNDSTAQRRLDYKIVVDDIAGRPSDRSDRAAFWGAFGRCVRRQARLLSWYYALVLASACMLGHAAKSYGEYQEDHPRYRWVADTFLLPNISEWYPLLTNFTIKNKATKVQADILCDDTLYQGTVAKHFLNKDGSLSGIILTAPKRFDRQAYVAAKNAGTTGGAKPKKEDFWREIPSARLYFFADRISNLNINYDAPEASKAKLEEYLRRILGQRFPRPTTITVEFQQTKKPDDKPASSS